MIVRLCIRLNVAKKKKPFVSILLCQRLKVAKKKQMLQEYICGVNKVTELGPVFSKTFHRVFLNSLYRYIGCEL